MYKHSEEVVFQEPRDVVSPREGKRWDSKPPLKPETDAEAFCESLQEVKDVVNDTIQGLWPTEFLAKENPSTRGGEVPILLADHLGLGTDENPNPVNLALAVSMDDYLDLGEALHDILLARGLTYKIHKPGTVQFCDTDSGNMAFRKDLVTSVTAAMDRVFDIKYYWKQPRPEDYSGVHGRQFTVNRYSAPGHFSYGAGHGAAAGATAEVVLRQFDLDDETWQHVLHACWVFAHGRTCLGVHFWEDNAEGFRVGRQF